jgi:hypothetical protein
MNGEINDDSHNTSHLVTEMNRVYSFANTNEGEYQDGDNTDPQMTSYGPLLSQSGINQNTFN